MQSAKQSSAATFRNIQRPYHGTGENRRIVTKHHKTPECSNRYRQRSRCDSRPDWHKLAVLISMAGHHNPHRGASVITIRIGRAGHHDPYRHRVTVPDWHKCKCTIVQAYYGPPRDWHKCKRTSPPTDKPSFWMGQPPIRGAYMISGAYGLARNDKKNLSIVQMYYYAGRRITAWTSLDTHLAGS